MEEKPSLPSDSLFDTTPEDVEEFQSKRRMVFEESIVEKVMSFYGIPLGVRKDLRDMCRDKTGFDRILFPAFIKNFDTFPIWLIPHKIRDLDETPLGRIFSPPLRDRSGLWKAFDRLVDQVDAEWLDNDRPYGVVFPWQHTKTKGVHWIMHNYDRMFPYAAVLCRDTDGSVRAFQPFLEFLRDLKWQP